MKKNKLESSFISFPNLPKKSPNIISLGSGDKAQCMTFQPHDILSANSVMQAIDLTSGGCGTSLQEVIEYIGNNDICSGGIHVPGMFTADGNGVRIGTWLNVRNRIQVGDRIVMRGDVDGADGLITASRIVLSTHISSAINTGEIYASDDGNGIYIPLLKVGTFFGNAASQVIPLEVNTPIVYLDENRYYVGCGETKGLTIMLPFLYVLPGTGGKVKNIDLYLKIGTLPLDFLADSPYNDDHNCILYRDGYNVQKGKSYEFNAHWNGRAWIISNYKLSSQV